MGPSGDWILRAVVHIQEHLDEPLDIQCLAGVARYSPWYFHRAFRGMVGEPVMEHLRRPRLRARLMEYRKALDSGWAVRQAFDAAREVTRCNLYRFLEKSGAGIWWGGPFCGIGPAAGPVPRLGTPIVPPIP